MKSGIGDGGRNAGGDGSFKLAWMWSDKERLSSGSGGEVVGRATSGSAVGLTLGRENIGCAAGGELRFDTAAEVGEDSCLTLGRVSSGDLGLPRRRWVWTIGSGVQGRSKTGTRSSSTLSALSTEFLSKEALSSRKRMRSAYETFNRAIPKFQTSSLTSRASLSRWNWVVA